MSGPLSRVGSAHASRGAHRRSSGVSLPKTELRLAELIRSDRTRAAELNAIIGAIGEGIVVVDGDGTVSLANRTARRMLGLVGLDSLDGLLGRFERPDEVRSRLPRGMVTSRLAGDRPRWLEVAAYPVDDEVGTDGDHAPHGEATPPTARARTGTGPLTTAGAMSGGGPRSAGGPLTGTGGGMILVLRDVSAARERDQARDAFIGMLSHELRTPITTIYAGAKLLARDGGSLPDGIRRGIFDDIHGEAERLHRLVEDVVALTRFGEGALEIGSEPVLLQRVLPAVARSEQGRWPGGSFDLKLEPDLPPVSGDATYVEQVVRNLLANAMKYGGSGARATMEATAANGEVTVRVLDEGPGFPDTEAGQLFDLYYRSPSVSRKVSGSGIGLFVCARLIQAMGGRIWAQNRPEGGAEFGFALRAMAEDR